jgi:hypothetical protein
MRRSTALLLAALVTLLGIARASPARAGTDARGPTAGTLVAVPVAGSPTTPSGDGFAIGLDPGATLKPVLAISNRSTDQRYTVSVTPVDATASGDQIEYADQATSGGTGSWVVANVREIVIEPGATTNVPFTLTVPDDAPTGSHSVAGVHLLVTGAQSTTGGASPASDLPSVYVPVIVNVAGDATPQLSVTSVVATHDSKSRTFLAVKLHNAGAVEAHAVGTVTSPGGETRRSIDVTVDPGDDRTVLVPWDGIDVVRGADVDVELDYGTGNTASWIGNVAAEPSKDAPNKSSNDGGDDGFAGTGASGGAHKGPPIGTILLVAFVVLMVLGALAFFVRELVRGGRAAAPVATMPMASGPIAVDVASLPALHVTLDPAHTDVLNALVTQVGALGGAIEKLADRVGVPVAIPPGPPLLTPQPQRRRHGRQRQVHSDDPVVTTSAPAPAAATASAPPRAVDPPLPAPAAAATAREFDDITAALHDLPEPVAPPRFVAPAPVARAEPVTPAPAVPEAPGPIGEAPRPREFEAPPFFAPPILPPHDLDAAPGSAGMSEPEPEVEPDDEVAELRAQRAVPAFIPPPRVQDDDWLSDDAIDAMLARREQPPAEPPEPPEPAGAT